MKPCPICDKQPKLYTYNNHPIDDRLFGAQYACIPWWYLGFSAHKRTTVKWNFRNMWSDLAVQRAAEEWESA